MRGILLLVAAGLTLAQTPDPAYEALSRAYESLQAKDYQAAIDGFQQAIQAVPDRASIRKDLAYTYLKTGENEAARAQFREAMRLDSKDVQVALEYAFLSYESKDKLEARRIFDRTRKTGNATAEQAFQNIDKPLADGIARWQEAIARGADDSGTHYELASLAEQRDDLELAAEQYRLAWQRHPDRRNILVDLGRVDQEMGRVSDASAVLLAASWSDDARTADMARERLPHRFPYVAEFREALELDPRNVSLRRELAYLLVELKREEEAEKEFRVLADPPANDLLSEAQLGFILYGRGQRTEGMVYLNRVLAGDDQTLANRVRAVLGMPQTAFISTGGEAREMAENSIKAGYIKDALKYLRLAYSADPNDMGVVLRMGWAANILHQDSEAFRWFALARQSSDPLISSEAERDWQSLRPSQEVVGVSGWMFPVVSTRWNDLFGYGQIRAEFHTHFPVHPFVSVRFDADTRSANSIPELLYSETSIILAAGLRTSPWHGLTGWFEAGSAANYLNGHMLPDFRGGISAARVAGRPLLGELTGMFADTNADAVFMSRFGNDFLVYSQSHAGYTLGNQSFRVQLFWCGNLTFDTGRQIWANFVDTGPGAKFHASFMPRSMYVIVTAVHGKYLMPDFNPLHQPYSDLKAGVWYAFSR